MFIFESEFKKDNLLVFFLGQYDTQSKAEVIGQVQKAYQEKLVPDAVVFIYPSYLKSELEELTTDSGFKSDVLRHEHSSVFVLAFDQYCNLEMIEEIAGNFSYKLDDLASEVIESGITAMISGREKEIVVQAPPGTVFAKPSGKVLEEFIYASQLARNNFEHQFLAMCLLKYSPKQAEIKHIYIDTASISALAEALSYYLSRFQNTKCKSVNYSTYSSYEGMEASLPDSTDDIWVIVSASANTSMAQKIVPLWSIRPEQVVTILSFLKAGCKGENNKGDEVVYCVKGISSVESDVTSPIKVQVQGESFSVEASSPDEMLLTTAHKPAYVDKNIFPFRGEGIFRLNCDDQRVFIDVEKFINSTSNSEFSEWLKQIVEWKVPKTLRAICYEKSDHAAKAFASLLNSILKKNGFKSAQISHADVSDHDELSKLGTSAVIVIAPAISSGRNFIDINRGLRLAKHKGMRVFISAFATPESQSSHKTFLSSLVKGVGGFDYSANIYKTVFVGHSEYSSWGEEAKKIRHLITQAEESKKSKRGISFWKKRLSILEKTGEGVGEHTGIHSSDSTKSLSFSKDFVFWPSSYSKSHYSLEAVYVTIATILQNAREHKVKNQQLGNNIYHHTVIAPDNFVRFNDSFLQSCLWRAASPRELDYRRSELMSNEFIRILSRMISANKTPRGEACLDLIMAVVIGWIKLTPKCVEELKADIRANFKEPHVKLLLDFAKW